MTNQTYKEAKEKALGFYNKANITLTAKERENLEVADFGLNNLEKVGLQIVTYINTSRVCSKEMVLFPNQTCPEHKHPTINSIPGKEETFRCRFGKVYLYVSGPETKDRACQTPNEYYTVFKEVVLNPGEQYTIYPDTFHWFQAGNKGAVISEFSTASHDDTDIFTDPNIKRIPTIE
jgi:D-lyxose ketol-isomerase